MRSSCSAARSAGAPWYRPILALLLIGMLALAACGDDGGEGTADEESEADASDDSGDSGDSDDSGGSEAAGGSWEEIEEAAREEGTLNLALHVGDGRREWGEFATERMADEYGIEVEFTQAPPSDLVPRMVAEQEAGEYVWDIYIAPTGNILTTLQPAGGLEELPPIIDDLPEDNRQDEDWGGGFELYTDPEDPRTFIHTAVITGEVYANRAEISEDVLGGPDDMDALLDPDIQSQLIMEEPTAPNGTANLLTWFLNDERADQYGEEYVRELIGGDQVTFTGVRDQLAQYIVEGRYNISWGPRQEDVEELIEAGVGGEDVEQLSWLKYNLARGISVPTNPPNPNAARVFLNWFLSQEAQDKWAEVDEPPSSHSRRNDVEDYYPDYPIPDYEDDSSVHPLIGATSGLDALERVLEIAGEELN